MSMRKCVHTITMLAVIFGTGAVIGQDLHWSQYNANPLNLNPALTGFFDGQFRITGNLRSQWGSFSRGYKTVGAGIEGSLFKNKLDHDYFGIGLMAYSDKAGQGALTHNNVSVSLAYNKALGYRAKHSMALGFQASLVQRKLDFKSLIFDSQYNGVVGTPDIPSGEPFSRASSFLVDLNVGLLYHWVPNKVYNFYLGGAYFHLTSPNQSFYGSGNDRLMPRYVGHIGAQIGVGGKFYFLPSALFQLQQPAMEIVGGTYLQFILNEFIDAKTAFAIGAWVRVADPLPDAVIVGARFDFFNVKIGMSYDMNISTLKTASNYRGAYEISLIYVGNVVTRGQRQNSIPCPQL